MSVLPGATNTTINNGKFTAVSHTTAVTNIGAQNDVVALLHSHSATAGLLDAKERFDAPKCDEGTRTSMILAMKKFVQDGDMASSPALYWLHGPAGVGKSALAQSLSLLMKSENDHAASFFFSRTSHGRNNGNQLVVTLAYQLATNFPALRRFMSKAVRNNPAILTASNAAQMQSLIIDPINKWHRTYSHIWSIWRWIGRMNNAKPHPRLILIDGLDECNDPKVQKDLIHCITSAVSQLSIPLRFVIASRPESHILATFELDAVFQGPDGVTVEQKNLGDDGDADEQITKFLLKEFAEIRRVHPIREFLPREWPRPDQINRLVSKSSKGFIYPATVIRYIKMPHSRPDQCLDRILGLSEIPTSDKPYEPLDSLYRHIFESVPEANKPSIHNIFHFLVLPNTWHSATSPTTIERHFDYPLGHVQHVLRDLLCLINFKPNGHIKILHASLPDFLLDKSRSGPLCIDIGNAHSTIATSYLRVSGICLSDEPPRRHSGFADFLDHLMQANISNALLHRKILQVDLLSRYKKICSRNGVPADEFNRQGDPSMTLTVVAQASKARFDFNFPDPVGVRTTVQLHDPEHTDVEGIAFMIAYFLVLVIRHGPEDYIRAQIAVVKAYILESYPVAASMCVVKERIVPIMTPLFRSWTLKTYHECINRIFACEVAPSQNELREAIFELHFLMMALLCQGVVNPSSLEYSNKMGHPTEDPEKRMNETPNFWADIVLGTKHGDNLACHDA